MPNVNLKPNAIEPIAPYTQMVAVIPSDTVALSYPTRGILVTVGGTIAVVMGQSSAASPVTIPAATAVAGVILPFSVSQIMATGTTATGLFALN
jgi:hypothetical protein